MGLKEVKEDWEEWGETDPYFAILTRPEKKGRGWDVSEFLASGPGIVEEALGEISSSGLSLSRRRALDFGCGVGRLTRPLGAKFDEVVGVDISSSMVRRAKELFPPSNCEFMVNDADNLSAFPDCHFDFIISLITLQHMEPKYAKGYLKEFARVLSHGGLAYFGIPEAWKKPLEIGPRARTWVANHHRALSLYRSVAGHAAPAMEMHGLKRKEVISLMQSAGCQVKSVKEHQYAGRWLDFRYLAYKP